MGVREVDRGTGGRRGREQVVMITGGCDKAKNSEREYLEEEEGLVCTRHRQGRMKYEQRPRNVVTASETAATCF